MLRKDIERGLYMDKDVSDVLFQGGKIVRQKPTNLADDETIITLNRGNKKDKFEYLVVKKEDEDKYMSTSIEGLTESQLDKKAELRQGFIKKVYGIFSVQLAYMFTYVVICHQYVTKEMTDNAAEQGMSAFNDHWAQNYYALGLSIVLVIVTIAMLLMQKFRQMFPLNYLLCLVFTVSLSYCVGFTVVSKDFNIVIGAFVMTLVLSLLMAFAGSHLVNIIGKKNESKFRQALGPTFGVLATIVVVILLLVNTIVKTNGMVLGLISFAVFIYMFIDTWLITSGKYDRMINTDDYIYASCKLFADFLLCFGIIVSMVQD